MEREEYQPLPTIPYVTSEQGIGGKIKVLPEDFIVGEVIKNTEKIILDPRMSNFNLPGKKGLFIHGVLIKKNIDTETALNIVAKTLGVSRKDIGYAGIKDKRAFTAQRISIWGLSKRFIEKGSLDFEQENIKLKGTTLRMEDIRLGRLAGNFFEITVRDITLDKETIKSRLETIIQELQDFGGIINGFDIQRFGEYRPISHTVGKYVILGKTRNAIKAYIGKTFGSEEEREKTARELYWKTENPHKTLALLPSHLHFERIMLRYLIEHPTEYMKCFEAISRQFVKLFVHAYQAYLFNNYLMKRYHYYSNDFKSPIEGEKVINKEVFAPILGAKVNLEGKVKEIYREILAKEGLSAEIFRDKKISKIGGKGTYRQILSKPINFRIIAINEDELNPNSLKLTVSFELQKGSYATLLLNEIMKINNVQKNSWREI